MKTFAPLLYLIIAIFSSNFVYAQTDVDALRYSRTTFGGTARSIGISGAFGALGADFASLSINPAGIGLFRSSEFTITPSLVSIQNNASYLGTNSREYKYNFNFSNLGMVISALNRTPDGELVKDDWVAINFGIGFNRTANFNRTIFFKGYNSTSSLLDRFVQDAKGSIEDDLSSKFPFGAGLAYDTWLINPEITDSTSYYHEVNGAEVLQKKQIISRGGINDLLFTVGANHKNKVYIGATLALPIVRYYEKSIYEEIDEQDSLSNFESFRYIEGLTTKGQGINLKLGLIYRIHDFVRIGGSVETPTYYYMKDNYFSQIQSVLDTTGSFESSSPDGNYRYDLYTPWKATASLAFIAGKYGFISVDYEFIDYSLSYFHFGSGSIADKLAASDINNDINSKYGPSGNIRIGAEIKIKEYRFRGGYAIYDSPFKNSATGVNDDTRKSLSFGFGLKEKDYSLDFALVRTTYKDYYVPYTLATETIEGVSNNVTFNNLVVTFGMKL